MSEGAGEAASSEGGGRKEDWIGVGWGGGLEAAGGEEAGAEETRREAPPQEPRSGADDARGRRASPAAQLAPRPAVGYNLGANKGPSLAHRLNRYAPGIAALRDYYRPWLRADVFAGIAVAAYLVPQVMAYASIVGVPPVAGLWTALMPWCQAGLT